jgi:hypothetical protein
MPKKLLCRCTKGDIVSIRGEVRKVVQIYSDETQSMVFFSQLDEHDEWNLNQYAGYWPLDVQVRLLGRE